MISDFFKNRRVLITGNTGFKGSWLSLWLLRLGANVRGFSLLPETSPSLFNLAGLDKKVAYKIGDVRDFQEVLIEFEHFKPEIVFHLAGQAIVRKSYAEPKATFDTNVGGTVNILEAIRNTSSVRAAVLITSDKCYKNREWVWAYREDDQMGGRDPYSASKAAAELVIAAYRDSFFSLVGERGIGIASARSGNVIGGGDFGVDRLLPDAVRAVLKGIALTVRNPESVRPWQHVLDPLNGYLMLAVKLIEDPERYSGAWNFGPESLAHLTVGTLVSNFFSRFGTGSWNSGRPERGADIHEAGVLRLAADKARSILRWAPVLSIDEALDTTASWYRKVLIEKEDAFESCLHDLAAFNNLQLVRSNK